MPVLEALGETNIGTDDGGKFDLRSRCDDRSEVDCRLPSLVPTMIKSHSDREASGRSLAR